MTTDFQARRALNEVETAAEAEAAHFRGREAEVAGYASAPAPVSLRGHAWTYAGLWFFTFLLIFRPAETIPGLAAMARLPLGVATLTLLSFGLGQIWLEGRFTARPREVNILLALCVVALMSIPTGIDAWSSRQTFLDVFIKAVLMFLVMVNVVRTEKRLQGMLFLTLTAGAFLGYNAINAYRNGLFSDEGYRVRGTLGATLNDPNDTALFLTTMIPIALALLLSLRAKMPRLLLAIAIVVMTAAIFVTYSRGGFLALCVGGLFLGWKLGRRAPVTAAAVGLIGLMVIAVALPPNYLLRLSSIADPSRDTRGSASARRALLNRSVEVALANPVLGVGMGNFSQVSIHGYASHNAYTQVASEMGLPALGIYLAFILTPLARLRRIEHETRGAARNHPTYKRIYYLSIGLQTSLICFMVGSFFLSVAYYWFLYYLVGYAVCLGRFYETGPGRIVGTFELAP